MKSLLTALLLSAIVVRPDVGPPVICQSVMLAGAPLVVTATGCVTDLIFENGFGW